MAGSFEQTNSVQHGRILKALETLAELSAFVGMIVLILISLAVTGNVLMRWLFAAPLNGVGDLSNLGTVIALSAALPSCLAHQGNIKVDLLGKSIGGRTGRYLDGFGALILLLFVAGMAWQLTLFAGGKTAAQETTWILGWKVAPWWWGAVGWFWLSVLCQAAVVYQLLFNAKEVTHY